jgi:excisionase family DNA binding protein
MTLNKDYLTVKELAGVMGISRIAVFNQIKLGKIKAEKIGRNYIIYKKDLPDIFNQPLSPTNKKDIEEGVKKVLKDYGETIKMLGQE